MTEMLKGVVENGTGQSGDYPNELAGKTGTTEHPSAKGKAKDVWFVGFTPEYVSALWMGYDHSDESIYFTVGSSLTTFLKINILSEIILIIAILIIISIIISNLLYINYIIL